MSTTRSGGRVLADQLRLHGVHEIFGVPGESYLPVLDALNDMPEIRFVVCRQEVGASSMAEAAGKLTGRPGVCFVTRGPGATHAAAGCHIARQDSTPMLLFVGQVPRAFLGREAFQEVDFRAMFGSLAKQVIQIESAERIPELVAGAFHTAVSGRPGPVVVALPEDVLQQQVAVADAVPSAPARSAPSPADMARLETLLAESRRPLLIVGGGDWSAEVAAGLGAFAQRQAIPVCAAFRRQDYVDNENPAYAGHLGLGADPRLVDRVRAADLLLVAGARLDQPTTAGYGLLEVPVPRQTLVHVHPDPGIPGRVYQPHLGMVSSMENLARALAALPVAGAADRAEWLRQARRDYEAARVPPPGDDALDLARVVLAMREILPPDAIVTNGAGNYTGWVHRYFSFRRFRTQLAPVNGAMGYGVPSAIAAKLLQPDRTVVSVNGDGCFMMCGHELATALQYDLAAVFIIVNNGMYGTIRLHQEKAYPGRPYASDLRNPDFVDLARAYGAHAERVERTEDFAPALRRSLEARRAAVIELRTDPDVLTTSVRLSEMG